jgi:hypothetical protein
LFLAAVKAGEDTSLAVLFLLPRLRRFASVMTLPRRRHPARSSFRSSYSSHLLSGKHLRRRTAAGGRAAAASCCWCCAVSPSLLDLCLQAGILCLLSALAISIVLIFGKALSVLQVHLNPPVVPQLDAVALPRRPIASPSLLRRGGTNGAHAPPRQQFPEPPPVWGMNLQVPSLGLLDFKRRIDPADRDLYEKDRARLLGLRDGFPSGTARDRAEPQPQDGEERYVPSDQLNQPRKCRRTAWHSRFYPTCNTFHELTLDRVGEDGYGHRFQRPHSVDG